jgi:hypothetical protein
MQTIKKLANLDQHLHIEIISMSRTKHSTLERPKVEPGVHPIQTTRYLLFTPSIEALLNEVCQWIENRVPGGMVYGKPRIGKTRAIKYLRLLLIQKFSDTLPIITLSCNDYTVPREGAFFQDLLRVAGHAVWKGGNAAAKRHRLNEFLIQKIELSGHDRLILFVDEAQKLHEQHYKWLIDLHNELDRHGLVLIVVLVGQEELLHQFSTFQLTKKTQIIGRFMSHQFRFRGLKSAHEMRTCLRNYDVNSEYPPGSSFAFTRYYFPAAFESGLRLEKYASVLWEAFREVREEAQLPITREIPMQYFCRTVEYVLKQFGTLEELARDLSLAQWKEAISKSGYANAERYIVEAE